MHICLVTMMDMKHIRRVNRTLFFYKYPYKGYKEIKMKSLSQSEYGELRDLYSSVYTTEEIIEEELVHEICDELVEELVAEGYSEDDAIIIVEDAANDYIDEAKVTFGHDTEAKRKSGAPVGARRRFAMRKAGETLKGAKKAAGSAYKTAKSKAAGAAVDASLAASAAKKAVGSATSGVRNAPGKVARAAARGTEKVEKKVKSGIKGFIKRQADKVISKATSVSKRMSEEVEALKATGKFSEKEIEAIMQAEMSEGYKEIDAKKHGRMYDRYKKLRSAAVQDARDSGEASGTNRMKMGKMSAVIDKSSENLRKKQTKDQLTGRG